VEKLAASEELRRSEAAAAAEQYIESSLTGLEEESGRFRYLFSRMRRAADHVLDNVVAELALSKFRPAAFELGFGRRGPLPPVTAENGVTVRLSGFVDRVDCWVHEGKRYLRVVDYKTGKKAFDFTDIENGLGLQMLLYLFTLEKEGKSLFGPEEIVPAGVLYLPARDPVVDGKRSMTDEQVRAAAGQELVRKGLVLADSAVLDAMEHTETGKYPYLPLGGKSDAAVSRDRLERLSELVEDKLHQAAGELAAGNIDADPYWRGEDKNACRWCDYAAACHFEPACGDKLRRQRALSAKEFWSALDKTDGEEEPDGHRPD
jgi:ATP-dependent helicase/nuclease subunit B